MSTQPSADFLRIEPIENGDLSGTTQAEQRCYEIGYAHGQTFTLGHVEAVVRKRTMRKIIDRIWDATVPWLWRNAGSSS